MEIIIPIYDLSRTVYIKERKESSDKEKRESNKNGYHGVETRTWVKVYPYTSPLLKLRIKNYIHDKAFKEKWPSQKIESKIREGLYNDTKKLVQNRTCFAMEIHSFESNAIKVKYWHGTLNQGKESNVVFFSEGQNYVSTSTSVTVIGNTAFAMDSHEYFLYSDVCANKKIDLTKPFTLNIEPRFRHDLLPFRLEWLSPKGNK